MCVITDEDHIVRSVSFIPGLGNISADWHCYFPVTGPLPSVGEVYNPTT